MKNGSELRVAMISVGLGRVRRGFERWCGDMYGVLRTDLDCTLYRSADAVGEGQRVPPFLGSSSAIFRRLPLGTGEKSEYKRECAAFGFSLLPELLSRKFDVIHCVDPPMAQVLRQFQRVLPLHGRILFTEGSALTPADYPRVDHLHLIAQTTFDRAVAHGIPSSKMTLVPSGVHTGRFALDRTSAELRRKHGVAEDTFVVLAVSALRRSHKRVDYIIDEFSKLEGDVLLWLDGHVEEPDLAEIAAARLGKRCRITHVPSGQVAELYGLADVMVHASLREAFGLSVVEALSSGVMVLAHRSDHFEWLVGDRDCLIDMSIPDSLASSLRKLAANRSTLCRRSPERAARARLHFDWDQVAPEYIRMYHKVAANGTGRRRDERLS